MIRGEGGFVHRMMPPTDWDCGPIPVECYNVDLSPREIRELLLPVYLAEDRIRKLADSDDPKELFQARLSLETLAEIDADTIFGYNIVNSQIKEQNEP